MTPTPVSSRQGSAVIDIQAQLKHLTPDALAHDLAPHRFIRHPMVVDIGREIAQAVARVKHNAALAAKGLPHGDTAEYIICEAPPRHGKSTLISEWTPVWFLRHWPTDNVAVCSYESLFAASWGRKIRDNIEEFSDQLGTNTRKDRRSVSDFQVTQGGQVFCTGIGGPLTGRGFQLLLVDDPVKNAKEAASAIVSEAHWEWWQSVASTRLEPGSVAVVMATRWDERDLIGRLLQAAKEDPEMPQWRRLKYPALAEEQDRLGREPGEALWPERYSLQRLRQIKKQVGPYFWAAMYEQRPAPLKGGMFEKDWFKIEPEPLAPNAVVLRVRAWDLASSTDGDYTAGVLQAKDLKTGNIRIEDIVHFRAQSGEVQKRVLRTAIEDGPAVMIQIQQDPGQAGKDQIEAYQKLLSPYAKVIPYSPSGDKVLRAVPASALAQGGGYSLTEADWNAPFLREAVNFKEGCAFDDQIDAMSSGHNLLQSKTGRFIPNARKREESEFGKILATITPRTAMRGDYRRTLKQW